MNPRRVLYVQYTNPAGYPPIVHSTHLLADRGWEVLVLGTDALAESLTFPRHERVEVRLRPFRAGGWLQKLHYLRFAAWVVASAASWRPSWVYASDPLSSPLALLLKQLFGLRVIYHEHDSPSPAIARRQSGTAFMRFIMKRRRALARRADLCVLPSAGRVGEFAATTGRTDAQVVWNCPTRAEATPRVRERSDTTLRVLYHGTIVPARVPPAAIEALAHTTSSVTLTLIGYETAGHPGYTNELTDLARRLGVADRLIVLPPVSRDQLMSRCGSFDVGLALLPIDSDDVNERSMVGASNKPFDYLACGLPVLVSALPDWRSTYVETGLGRSCDPRSASSIAAEWQWLAEHPHERQVMGQRGRRKILVDWNYEKTFQPVVARMLSTAPAWPEAVPSIDSIG